MGEASQATVDGNVVATWRDTSRNSFDQKKFEKDHPALFEKYKKTSKYRQFRINKGDK
jgi:predicted phage-related endonuclease